MTLPCRFNVGFTCKRGWRGPGPARAVTDAIDRWKLLLNTGKSFEPTQRHQVGFRLAGKLPFQVQANRSITHPADRVFNLK